MVRNNQALEVQCVKNNWSKMEVYIHFMGFRVLKAILRVHWYFYPNCYSLYLFCNYLSMLQCTAVFRDGCWGCHSHSGLKPHTRDSQEMLHVYNLANISSFLSHHHRSRTCWGAATINSICCLKQQQQHGTQCTAERKQIIWTLVNYVSAFTL